MSEFKMEFTFDVQKNFALCHLGRLYVKFTGKNDRITSNYNGVNINTRDFLLNKTIDFDQLNLKVKQFIKSNISTNCKYQQLILHR